MRFPYRNEDNAKDTQINDRKREMTIAAGKFQAQAQQQISILNKKKKLCFLIIFSKTNKFTLLLKCFKLTRMLAVTNSSLYSIFVSSNELYHF